MSTPVRSDAIYTMGRTDAETQRLIRQSLLYNPITERMLEDSGITAGMRVLDVGTGAGDVAMLAAVRVGTTGSVVAIDTNPKVLLTARKRAELAGLTNVTFAERDCRELSQDDVFDAATGRLVLMYTPEPARALASVADHVLRGGGHRLSRVRRYSRVWLLDGGFHARGPANLDLGRCCL